METVKHNCDKSYCVLHFKNLLNFRIHLLIAGVIWTIRRILLTLFVGFWLMILISFIFMALPREDDDQSRLVDNSGIGRERTKIFAFDFII